MDIMHINGVVIAERIAVPRTLQAYRGAASGTWWPLARFRYAHPEARALTLAVESAQWQHPADPLWPAVTTDPRLLRAYLDVCRSLGLTAIYGELCSSPIAPVTPIPRWIVDLRARCERLGVDVAYGTGTFSFIESAPVAANPAIADMLSSRLNRNGLFDTVEDARDYLSLYEQTDPGDMSVEDTDGAILLELWEDVDARAIREAIEPAISAP